MIGGLDVTNAPSDEALHALRGGEIEWLGELEDVRPYLAAAGLLLLPTLREGLPQVVS